jgi:hypothetical protein
MKMKFLNKQVTSTKFSAKQLLSTIALILILTVSGTAVFLPTVSAHTPAWNIPTYAFINAAPNPVGVGQKVSIIMWVDKIPDGAALANDIRFHNYQLKITAPDGTTQIQAFPVANDPTSGQFYAFTPTQVGTYTFNFTFPGQVYTYTELIPGFFGPPAPSAFTNDTYLPSTASTTITVQQAQLPPPINSYPLPTSYWTRPIYGENSYWFSISSNWLGTGAPGYSGFAFFGSNQQSYPGDAVGPQTSHVMWTKPLQSGGVVGGNNFVIPGDTYFEGSAYQQRYTNPIILNGRLYYTAPVSFSGPSSGPTVCVDLRTGQVIWSRTDVPPLSFGYIYDVQDPNQHGVYPAILIATAGGGFFGGATTWEAFDADTGNFMFNVTNIPSGTSVLGVNGEHLIYVINNAGNATKPNWYLGEWNSSRLWDNTYSGPSTSPPIVPPITNGNDPSLYDWNISIPAINTMPGIPGVNPVTQADAFYNNMLICYNGTLPAGPGIFSTTSWTPYTYFSINLNPTRAQVGQILWWNTINPPPGNVTVFAGPADPTAGVFTEAYKETIQWIGYSMTTGQRVWGPTPPQTSFDYYGTPAVPDVQGVAAYGHLYSSGFGGILYCYDMATGNLLWTYGNGGTGNSTRAGFQTPYGEYPTFINAIGNGIVYLVSTEHTVETPIYKGAMARAVDATTGKEIWTLSDYTGEFTTTSYAIADGFATFFNGYDNQIYVVGRGPSATTVQAPLTVIPLHSGLEIQGTVTDISAGTKQTQQAADFPNGVPAVSDASMKDWMGYVYQQKPCPTNTIGVNVTLSELDSNGNTYTIGTATTDGSGMYSLMWQPPIPGKYIIYATFAGTNSYWPSSAETAVGVTKAPTAVPITSPTASSLSTSVSPSLMQARATAPTTSTNLTLIAAVAAVAAAIIIVIAVLAAVVLRRRK